MRKGLISHSLAANSLLERYANQSASKFQDRLDELSWVEWARKPEYRELRPDSLEYVPRPLIARLSQLLP